MNLLNKNSNAEDLKDLPARVAELERRVARLEAASAPQEESLVEAVEASPLAPAVEAAPADDHSEELKSLRLQLKACEDEIAIKKGLLEDAKRRADELVEDLRQNKSQQEAMSVRLSECETSLNNKEAEITAKEHEYADCYNLYKSYEQKCIVAEQKLQDTRTELSDTQSALSGVRRRVELAESELSNVRLQLEQESQAHQSILQAQEATQAELQSTQQALATEQQKVQCLSAELSSCKVLADRLWPDCLRIPALADYAAVWREELSNPSADPILLSMFANIFSWACAHEVAERGEGDSSFDQAAIVSLYTFSRFFFEWLSRHRKNPEEADRLSHALSSHINSKLEASNRDYRIETEEVQIGDPYSSKMMMPSPRGASTGEVASIESWCIMNRSGSVCHKKAQVCLEC